MNLRGKFQITKYCPKHSRDDKFNYWQHCKACEKEVIWFCEPCQVYYEFKGKEDISGVMYNIHICPGCNDLQNTKI